MAARYRGGDRKSLIQMGDYYRGKIQSANLIMALAEHAVGRREMSATQVQAARILLAKVLPDISHVTLAGDASAPLQTRLTVSWEAVDVKQIEHKPTYSPLSDEYKEKIAKLANKPADK